MTLSGLIECAQYAVFAPYHARLLIQLPDGEFALVSGIKSRKGEIIIQTTRDHRSEIEGI